MGLTRREQEDYTEIRARAQVLTGHLRLKPGWPTADSAYDLSSDADKNLLQALVRAVSADSQHLDAELEVLRQKMPESISFDDAMLRTFRETMDLSTAIRRFEGFVRIGAAGWADPELQAALEKVLTEVKTR